MKIQYASDLHLEFDENTKFLKEHPLEVKGDILVLAGDIILFGEKLMNEHPFWDWCSDHYTHTLIVPGNHEYYNGKYSSTTNATAKNGITRLGQAKNTSNYIIYCFGAENWNNNRDNFVTSDITALDNYLGSLSAADRAKPIFILSHFTLHSFSSRSLATNANQVISTLNKYADQGYKLYFLWGHNHTVSDTHYDEVFTGSIDGTAISFTYLAAGCMSGKE